MLAALLVLASVPAVLASERSAVAGFFVQEHHCGHTAHAGPSTCEAGYVLDDLDGNRVRVELDARKVAAYGGPSALLRKWVRVSGKWEGDIFRMQGFSVLDASTLAQAEQRGDVRVLEGMSAAARRALQARAGAAQERTWMGNGPEIRPYLTLLCRTSDTIGITPRPQIHYHLNMASIYPGMDHFMLDMSYGKASLATSDTLDWINLPKPKSEYLTATTHSGQLAWDGRKLLDDLIPMLDASVDFRKYRGINMFLNSMDEWGGASASGYFMTVDGMNEWMPITTNNGGFGQSVLGHEVGHNYGMDHTSGPYQTPYDSAWSVMSGGGHWVSVPTLGDVVVSNGYNAHHRYRMGWIPRERVVWAQSGADLTFRLERLTNPISTTDPLMAKIYIKGSARHYYTLEARRKVGYDKALPADCVVIHDVVEDRVVTDPFSVGPRIDRNAQVVDPDGNGDPNDAAAQWVPGETFTDVDAGIQVDVLSQDASGFTVRVRVDASQPAAGIIRSGADDGAGTLRDWFYYRRDFPGAQPAFRIPLTDPSYDSVKGFFRIRLKTPLPEIGMNGLELDGATQTSFTGDTNPNGPEVMLDGRDLDPGSHGLHITGSDVAIRNLAIGNFPANGIQLRGTRRAVIERVFSGVEPDGSTRATNGWDGISLAAGATECRIGTPGAGNLVSGNKGSGIGVFDAATSNNRIQANRVGTTANGLAALPNEGNGISSANHATDNWIGGDAPGEGNLLSGNGSEGVEVWKTHRTQIVGNWVGMDATGKAKLANGAWGIAIRDGSGQFQIRKNVVSGNGSLGIGVGDPDIREVLVEDNLVGLDRDGEAAVPNGGFGVFVFGGARQVTIRRNTSAGNQGEGVAVTNAGTAEVLIEENRFGTDPTGLVGIPNLHSGIWVGDGATAILRGNIASGNTGVGIQLHNAQNVLVENNLVGMDATGEGALGNGAHGITVVGGTKNSVIGGTSGKENIIAANGAEGIVMADPGTDGNLIAGNFIGLTRTGVARGNKYSGIWMGNGAKDNRIGEPGKPNHIGANGGSGIAVGQAGTSGNRIRANRIGLWTDGTSRGNKADGVVFWGGASGNVLGGTAAGEGNRIAYNAFNGVSVADAATVGNSIRANSISSNARLGINLVGNDGEHGVTANDSGDLDNGPNRLQNFPTLSVPSYQETTLTVQGTLRSLPNRSYAIDLFGVSTPDPSGHGEGDEYLGSVNVTTGSTGMASFTLTVPRQARISATATDLTTGDTSEFAPVQTATPGLKALRVSPVSVPGGQSVQLEAELYGPVSGGASVPVTVSPSGFVSFGGSISIPAGSSTQAVALSTNPVPQSRTLTFTASYRGVERTATLTLTPPTVSSLTVTPSRALGGTTLTATIRLNVPAPAGGLKVNLKYSNASVTPPATATVPGGATSVQVKLPTKPVAAVTSGTLTATYGTSSRTAVITLDPPALTGVTVSPANVPGGLATTARVTLSGKAPAAGMTVFLKRSHSALNLPASIVVPSGQTSASISASTKPVLADTKVMVTATMRGVSKTANLAILAPKLAAINAFPTTLKGGTTFSLNVTLSSAAPSGLVLQGSALPALVTFPTLAMKAGATSQNFTCTTKTVRTNTTVRVRVVMGGIARFVDIVLTP